MRLETQQPSWSYCTACKCWQKSSFILLSGKVKKGIGGALKTNKDINHNSIVNEMDVFAFELKALSHTSTVYIFCALNLHPAMFSCWAKHVHPMEELTSLLNAWPQYLRYWEESKDAGAPQIVRFWRMLPLI